jgi:hypothetical protein
MMKRGRYHKDWNLVVQGQKAHELMRKRVDFPWKGTIK